MSDWVTKYQLIERYRIKHDLPLSAPGRQKSRRLMLDLTATESDVSGRHPNR